MSYLKWPVFILAISILSINTLWGDDDEEEQYENRSKNGIVTKLNTRYDFAVVTNSQFKAECTSCHMAYLPGMLPARSWTKMMETLNDHFGENAELDVKVKNEITDFLIKNSSDKVHTKRGDKILATINPKETVLRISTTEYFKRKHDEISPSVYKRKTIGSPANCLACHGGAERGDFSEDSVLIPKDKTPTNMKK